MIKYCQDKKNNKKEDEMFTVKLCPIRWGKAEGSSAHCIKGTCAFWVDGACAIVKIAKFVSENDDDG